MVNSVPEMSPNNGAATDNNLRSLIYSNDLRPTLSVLDQLLVPHETKYVAVPNVAAAFGVIRSMRIRGAPLIAIVAALSLAVDLTSHEPTLEELRALGDDDAEGIKALVLGKMEYLKTSRPTAVNLFNAMRELKGVVEGAAFKKAKSDGDDDMTAKQRIVRSVIRHAEFFLERDVADNKAIGKHGADEILIKFPNGARLVTICNTGSLATAGFGTALGVARELQGRGKLESIAALETRPYNQGSRLTAYEIVQEKMPNGTLICDAMAASYLRLKGADACVVGADRVCANGDTANKIGTYQLSIVAKAHGVDFYVASPFTTLDPNLATGDEIEIEERPAKELLESSGAPKEVTCWNPAFDVTPAEYITGIITEKGVLKKSSDGTFDVKGFIEKHS